MQVLHINQQSSSGGAAGVAIDLVEGLRHSGIHSELWYFRENKTLECTKPLFPLLSALRRNKGANKIISAILRRYFAHYGDISNPIFWMAKQNILDWKPDILHLHNVHGGWADLKIFQALADNIPIVITLHDEWIITGHCGFTMDCLRWKEDCRACPHLNWYSPISRDIAFSLREGKKRFLQALARQNAVLVTPSEWLKKRVMESGLWQGREIEVIHNGIHIERFEFSNDNKQELRLKHGLSSDEKVGLFIADGGSQNYFKGFDLLKKAMLSIPDGTKLTVIVIGDKIAERRIERRGNVKEICEGYLSLEQMKPYFVMADFFIYPTRADSFGLVVLEAMAAKLLVVASNIGSIPEVVGPEAGFLFKLEDADALRDIIIKLTEENVPASGMISRAHKRAVDLFSFDRMLQQYISLYKRCQRC